MDFAIRYSKKGFPYVNSTVYESKNGVRYLKSPGVAVISVPEDDLTGIQGFLNGFSNELGFAEYLNDPAELKPAESVAKFAGQLCYLSFGPNRTMNRDAQTYFDNVKSSGHGSLLEHANFTVFWWGISRSLTHELVRHRAGFGFSQVSQRYVGGKTLRFVERPEYQSDEHLHNSFLRRIERNLAEYEDQTEYLVKKQTEGDALLSADRKTDLRKKVRQASRSLLPNETETAIVITANVRAWRHFFNMRVSEHAEVEIRRAGFMTFRCLYSFAPHLFRDFTMVNLSDGTDGLTTPYPKV